MLPQNHEPLKKLFCKPCNRFLQEPCWKHTTNIPDKPVIPYALGSLPDALYMDYCGEWSTERGIFARDAIASHTVFGPLVAPLSPVSQASTAFACRKEPTVDLGYYQLDSDYFCNWMKFVRFSQNRQEENVAVYMRGIKLIFITTRDIPANEELKLGYSAQYAETVRERTPELVLPIIETVVVPLEKGNDDDEMDENPPKKKKKVKSGLCTLCNREFTNVKKHLQTVHVDFTKKEFKYECAQCTVKFPTLRSRDAHQRTAHRTVSVAPESSAVSTAIEYMKTTGLFTYYCRPCLRHFPSKALLDLHEFQHQDASSPLTVIQRICPQCDFVGKSFSELVQHTTEHAIKPTEKKCCLLCGEYAFKIGTHIRACHTQEFAVISADWPLVCEECGMKFMHQKDLGLHVTTVHKGFQCLYCAKLFYTSAKLTDHMEEHKKDGKYPCLWCERTFETYAQCRAHHTDVHGAKGVKVCDVCQMVCSNAAKLAFHKKVHTPGVIVKRAPIPGRKRKSSEERQLRKRTRARDRVECDICGAVMNKHSLWKHRKWVHNADEEAKERKKQQRKEKEMSKEYVDPRRRMTFEEFPFKCEVCRLGFMKQIMFNKHMQDKHT
ncbi:PR domain zinc finger protein 10-like [Paramacrobiotus metropolitanus]|uniref:PR domain zinc finger protein 10-like n=1 Tax=Paramacrobiotus metropolitanus TaxID=2943436 RepID=UPI002445A447|nr:PR domain zinc finger protein 10-like [Paramacrobiotus metropolitanus]